MKHLFFLFTFCSFSLLALTSCEEDADNKLAVAQECFDNVSDSAPAADALACEAKLGGVTTTESYVLRCAIRFFVGGVRASDIISAYTAMDGASEDDKAAILIAGLSHTDGSTDNEKRDNALSTQSACNSSGVPSLINIANLSYAGTLMTTYGSSTDPNVFLANCDNGGVCDDAAVGSAVIALYDSYCIGDAAEEPTCQEINNAIAAGGSDPSAVALQLYMFLQ